MKTRQQKLIAGVVALVAVLFGWYKVVWSAQSAAIAKATLARAAADGETRKTRTEANRLEKLKSDTSREAVETKLSAAVPAEPDLATFLRWIKQTGAEHRLEMPSVGHTEPVLPTGVDAAAGGPDGGLYQVNLTVQAKGEYADLLDFVHALETTERLIVIDTVTFTKDSGSGSAVAADDGGIATTSTTSPSSPTLTANITARMFSRHALDLAEAAAAAAAAVPTVTTVPAAASGAAAAGAEASAPPVAASPSTTTGVSP